PQRRRARPAGPARRIPYGPRRRSARLSRQSGESMTTEILWLTLEHIELVLVAIAVAAGVGLPAAVLLTRRARARRWALGFANIAQTVPSLALFGFLVPVIGI